MRPARFIVLAALALTLLGAPDAAAISGPQVPGLQAALRARGLYLGQIDGIPGPLTDRAVRRLQRRHGLRVDGIAGPRTRRALGRLGRPLFGTRVMRPRAVGWDVAVLQFLLARRGHRPGVVDGYFGVQTARALHRFQRRAGLVVDGLAGPATLGGLRGGHARPTRGRRASAASIRRGLDHWAGRSGMRSSIVRALAWMESGNQPNVTSPAGAWGVMQVMPATWGYVENVLLGTRVPRTADGNIRIGVTYLHHLLHRFDFDKRLTLAAYNQGPASVRRHGLFPETRAFVR
ncbi:MAG: peptidoglycan-binding protein, partial [Gaiellaceae bacterium]